MAKVKKSEMKVKKASKFNDWLKEKILVNLPYGVEFVNMKYGWNTDERILTFRITDDRITTAEDDERFGKMVDSLYDFFGYYHGKGLADAGFQDAPDDKTFTWMLRDDRHFANYEEIDGESNTDDSGYWATKKTKKTTIKKNTRGMLMGRGALEKFKDLIQTIKSEEGIDFGDDEGFDTLVEFYMNCVEEYNAMVNGEGPQFYASTKKSKMKKSAGLDRIWQDWMNVSDEEAEAITDVFDEYGLDFDNVGGLIQLASDKVGRKNASTKKSIPNATMSFTENVNKMRVNNYAKTGNINTVMKKSD